jgi:hypothetical protein
MRDLDKIDFGELKKAIAAMNETGLLPEPLKVAFIKKETMLKQFAEAVEAVEDPDKLPEIVIIFYNENVSVEPGDEPEEEEIEEETKPVEKDPVVEEEEAEMKEADKKKKEEKDKGKKKKDKPKKKSGPKKQILRNGPRGRYGHIEGTQAYAIDEALFQGGMTSAEIAKASYCAVSRVNAHIKHLREVRGIEVIEGKNADGKKTFSTTLEKWEKPAKEKKEKKEK